MSNKNENSQNTPEVLPPYGFIPYCPPQEETIDLRELWAVLKRRKSTVWKTTIFMVLIAGIYLLFAHPVYEVKATIGIGKQLIKTSNGTLQEKYFEDASRLKAMLDAKYDTAGKYREKNETTYIDSVSVPKKTKGFVVVTAVGASNEEAEKTLQKPINELIERGSLFRQSIIDVATNQLSALQSKIDYLKNVELLKRKKELELARSVDLKNIDQNITAIKSIDIPTIDKKIEELQRNILNKKRNITRLNKEIIPTAQKDPALGAMASMQLANLQNDIATLSQKQIELQQDKEKLLKIVVPVLERERTKVLEELIPQKEAAIKKLVSIDIPKLETQIADIQTSIKPPYLINTHLVGKIRMLDHPVKPKKKLILVVAFITGLMLGIFLAFFKEFIGKEKEAA